MQRLIEATERCQRFAWRLKVDHREDAFVKIDLVGKSHWRLKLVEISEIGVAFRLQNGRPSLAVGSCINGVKLHVAGLRIVGNIRVVHLTPKTGEDTICGAEFNPSAEVDRNTMTILRSCLERRTPRPD